MTARGENHPERVWAWKDYGGCWHFKLVRAEHPQNFDAAFINVCALDDAIEAVRRIVGVRENLGPHATNTESEMGAWAEDALSALVDAQGNREPE